MEIINGLNTIQTMGFQSNENVPDKELKKRCLFGCAEKQSLLSASKGVIDQNLLEFVTDYLLSSKSRGDNKDREYKDYAPARGEGLTFDTLVLSRSDDFDFLESWRQKGFSSHAFVSIEGQLIFYINPRKHKGQMAGVWNSRSLEVLVQTDKNHNINQQSMEALKFFKDWFNGTNKLNKIAYCLSHGEAKGSEQEGTITNINDVREFLELGREVPEVKIYEQAELDA